MMPTSKAPLIYAVTETVTGISGIAILFNVIGWKATLAVVLLLMSQNAHDAYQAHRR